MMTVIDLKLIMTAPIYMTKENQRCCAEYNEGLDDEEWEKKKEIIIPTLFNALNAASDFKFKPDPEPIDDDYVFYSSSLPLNNLDSLGEKIDKLVCYLDTVYGNETYILRASSYCGDPDYSSNWFIKKIAPSARRIIRN